MAREDLNPFFAVFAGGVQLGTDVSQFIKRVTVEYAEGVVWMAELHVSDARDRLTNLFALMNSTVFQWGNEIDIHMGYNAVSLDGTHGVLSHMGRFIVTRIEANFPDEGNPGFIVKAYTADFRMISNSPDGAKRGKALGTKTQGVKVTGSKKPSTTAITRDPVTGKVSFTPRGKKAQPKGQQHVRVWKDIKYEDVIAEVASTYAFITEIDTTNLPPQTFTQKVGISDFDLVRGIANIVGFLFWVDGDDDGNFTLHFRDPRRIYDANAGSPVQERRYAFYYGPVAGLVSPQGGPVNPDQSGSLLSFQPEGSVVQEHTKLRVVYTDPRSGKHYEEEIDEDAFTEDLAFTGDPKDQIKSSPETGGAVRLFWGEFSIATVADKHFKNALELRAWTVQWFQRNRERFQQGNGKVVGIPDLRCFQIHDFGGVGPWSGAWYMNKVTHVMDVDSGYLCDFHARKVIRPADGAL